jgi:hypothetical protein
MIREMLRISLLLAGATVGLTVGDVPVMAQQNPAQARIRAADTPTLRVAPQNLRAQPVTPARRLDATENSVKAQSCASLGGASADRCYSDLRTKIMADDLRNRALEASQDRQK